MKITDTSVKVTNIYFVPMNKPENVSNPNFIGFISLTYAGFNFKSISVFETPERDRMWIDYPKDVEFDRVLAGPANGEVHKLFEDAIVGYVREHYVNGEVINQPKRGLRHAKRTISTESEGSKRTEAATGT